MTSISRNTHLDLNGAHQEPRAATKPVVVTKLPKAIVLSPLSEASKDISTITVALEYEVFCPNCARVEVASTLDQSKHRCNCGYGVAVEMLRTSPN